MKSFLFIVSMLVCLNSAIAARKPVVVMLAKKPAQTDLQAARILRGYLEKLYGTPVSMQQGGKVPANKWPVFVGKNPRAVLHKLQKPPAHIPDDAFFLHGNERAFLIAGGGRYGTEYGVYTFLEMLGLRKYNPEWTYIPPQPPDKLPVLPPTLEVPAFPYRELHYEPAFNDEWARWHKLKRQTDKQAEWGMFVHTFHTLCPEKTWFETHPEYFAWNGAQRSPGQPCLSNDTVLQIVIDNLRAKMRENPKAIYWSVSQNDNYDYCKCPRCAASDKKYGSPAGTLLAFVNAVAAAFPDKTISTLAYQYTRKAPAGIQPASNVSVCLCSIECDRARPLEASCTDFARDVREWSELCPKLMIWDYVVQFRSYVSPFPNWQTLQPNLQFFQDNRVNMLFEQGSGRSRSEFSDMRAYLLAKLMWNPRASMDSLLNDFGSGYFGAARAAVWEYIFALSSRLEQNGNRLWIYDIPQNEAFLQSAWIDLQLQKLEVAEKLPTLTPLQRRAVQNVEMPLLFARLECIKTDSLALAEILQKGDSALRRELQRFEETCRSLGLLHLHEMGYSLEQYRTDYQKFLEKQVLAFSSQTRSVKLSNPASAAYAGGRAAELINRRIGETDYRYNWLGFEGTDMEATLELKADSCRFISVSFLQDQGSWVFYPQQVTFDISTDGQHFETVYETVFEIRPDGRKSTASATFELPAARAAKAVRVRAVNQKKCPGWHNCTGQKAWIFADEILVR